MSRPTTAAVLIALALSPVVAGVEVDPVRPAAPADAMEESGCDDEQILGHPRGPGPHMRGCHALDLLAGRL